MASVGSSHDNSSYFGFPIFVFSFFRISKCFKLRIIKISPDFFCPCFSDEQVNVECRNLSNHIFFAPFRFILIQWITHFMQTSWIISEFDVVFIDHFFVVSSVVISAFKIETQNNHTYFYVQDNILSVCFIMYYFVD